MHDLEQPHLFAGIAEHVHLVERALLEEAVPEDLRDEQDEALRVGQHVGADQLDDLLEAVLLLKRVNGFRAQGAPVGGHALPTTPSRRPRIRCSS